MSVNKEEKNNIEQQCIEWLKQQNIPIETNDKKGK